MAYEVTLRENATGAEAAYKERARDWSPTDEFMWSCGNYGCDCNRRLFFLRARGLLAADTMAETACGESAYAVVRVTDGAGATVHEGDPRG